MKHFKLIKQTQTQMFMRGSQAVRTQAVAAAMDSRPVYTRGVTPNSFFVATQSRGFAAKLQEVPSMGDSISEGVVQEFVVAPGQAVKADDIIAKIETDKVTVDILA